MELAWIHALACRHVFSTTSQNICFAFRFHKSPNTRRSKTSICLVNPLPWPVVHAQCSNWPQDMMNWSTILFRYFSACTVYNFSSIITANDAANILPWSHEEATEGHYEDSLTKSTENALGSGNCQFSLFCRRNLFRKWLWKWKWLQSNVGDRNKQSFRPPPT